MAELPNNTIPHVVVIAGGSGTRFWPRSRQGKPKQLLAIWDNKSLLTHTLERFDRWPNAKRTIVTTRALVEASKEVLKDVRGSGDIQYLGEPMAKNTAPCIYWALKEIQAKDPEAIVCVVPADHYVGDSDAFIASLQTGYDYAKKFNGIVTLGVKPNRPETGYGYIKIAGELEGDISLVEQFVEKPDLRTALSYLTSGKYLWNAGIFICKVSVGVSAFKECMPALVEAFNNSNIEETYAAIDAKSATSIDFGIMELAPKKNIPLAVLAVDYMWSDLGSYTALEEIDKSVVGTVVTHNAASNIVQCDSGIVALLGVNDMVVVKDGDAVLVANKGSCQDIRMLVERIKKEHPDFA